MRFLTKTSISTLTMAEKKFCTLLHEANFYTDSFFACTLGVFWSILVERNDFDWSSQNAIFSVFIHECWPKQCRRLWFVESVDNIFGWKLNFICCGAEAQTVFVDQIIRPTKFWSNSTIKMCHKATNALKTDENFQMA